MNEDDTPPEDLVERPKGPPPDPPRKKPPGIPWTKGKSANPGGTSSAVLKALRELRLKHLPNVPEVFEALRKAAMSGDPEVMRWAIPEYLNRMGIKDLSALDNGRAPGLDDAALEAEVTAILLRVRTAREGRT